MNWTPIEDAIHDWFAAAMGLDGKRVIWSNQPIPRQARPYATLNRTSVKDLSPLDEQRASYDSEAPAGQEIVLRSYGPRQIVVSCNVYSDVVTGDGTAQELIEKARSDLSKRSVLRALRTGGVGLVSRGQTRDLSRLVETAFESRAQMDVTFSCADSVEERTTYIEAVEVSPAS